MHNVLGTDISNAYVSKAHRHNPKQSD